MKNHFQYYKAPAIRQRISEGVGSASYIVGYGVSEIKKGNSDGFYSAPRTHLNAMLDRGLDILTSSLRQNGTIGIIDVEYYNHKYPGEAYINPYETFKKIEPLYKIICNVLNRYGIKFLSSLTGQGYHFWTKWNFDKDHHLLENIGKIEKSLWIQYNDKRKRNKFSNKSILGFAGMNRLIQFIGHRIILEVDKYRKSGKNILPIMFSDIKLPFSHEAINLDLTTYADPIYMRDIRVPFSVYQKHKVNVHKVGKQNARRIPVFVIMPRHLPNGYEMSLKRTFELRYDYRKAVEFAKKTRTFIPESSVGWKKALSAFKKSRLGKFYHYYDSMPRPKARRFTYKNMPPCIAHLIKNPDPNLLEPTNLLAIVRVLDKMGWHPQEIAHLIYLRYKKIPFYKYNRERRAHFWVEQYAGLIHAGIDKKKSLNCVSHQDRGQCIKPWCGFDLKNYQ